MKIEIEGHVVEASAVSVTLIDDCGEAVMDAARKLIERAHGRKAIVFQRQSNVEQREDFRFECEVELRDSHPANAPLERSARSDDTLRGDVGHE
jgi:hypothetical protein